MWQPEWSGFIVTAPAVNTGGSVTRCRGAAEMNRFLSSAARGAP